jgi:hypothetical protein
MPNKEAMVCAMAFFVDIFNDISKLFTYNKKTC